MEKIQYEYAVSGVYVSPLTVNCPYGNSAKVGSMSCNECTNFINQNRYTQTVTCNYLDNKKMTKKKIK